MFHLGRCTGSNNSNVFLTFLQLELQDDQRPEIKSIRSLESITKKEFIRDIFQKKKTLQLICDSDVFDVGFSRGSNMKYD